MISYFKNLNKQNKLVKLIISVVVEIFLTFWVYHFLMEQKTENFKELKLQSTSINKILKRSVCGSKL